MLGAIALVFARDGNEVALAAAFAAMTGSFLVSSRAREAEALGLKGDVGLGSRAERVVVISRASSSRPGAAAVGRLPAAVTAWITVVPARAARAASSCRAIRC